MFNNVDLSTILIEKVFFVLFCLWGIMIEKFQNWRPCNLAGEMIVGPVTALFMDEISTGLDSSTTFSIVKNLGQIAHVMKSTIIVSLLQPAPETFDLFDDIILLSEGQVVYHGPREHIVSFFESCGFRCPERKGVADFLQEVCSQLSLITLYIHTATKCGILKFNTGWNAT